MLAPKTISRSAADGRLPVRPPAVMSACRVESHQEARLPFDMPPCHSLRPVHYVWQATRSLPCRSIARSGKELPEASVIKHASIHDDLPS